jgi:PTH1 family peptidyl-tRNA hydrolase
MRSSGSSGGHNGVESLIYHLGTQSFPRLRCGVGNDFGPGEMVDYVLAAFPVEQAALLEGMIEAGRDAALLWIVEGTAKAMNLINREKKKEESRSEDTSSPAEE